MGWGPSRGSAVVEGWPAGSPGRGCQRCCLRWCGRARASGAGAQRVQQQLRPARARLLAIARSCVRSRTRSRTCRGSDGDARSAAGIALASASGSSSGITPGTSTSMRMSAAALRAERRDATLEVRRWTAMRVEELGLGAATNTNDDKTTLEATNQIEQTLDDGLDDLSSSLGRLGALAQEMNSVTEKHSCKLDEVCAAL